MSPPQRHRAGALIDFAARLLAAAGMPDERARAVAETLVEADLLGHTTHGLHLLAPYLADIEQGAMTLRGEPETVADSPGGLVWDGSRLCGVWLVREAQKLAERRARAQGTCTVVIRRSHH